LQRRVSRLETLIKANIQDELLKNDKIIELQNQKIMNLENENIRLTNMVK